jgi:hypothetical protein
VPFFSVKNEKEIEELYDLIYFFIDYIVSKNLRRDFYEYLNRECKNEKFKQKVKQIMYLYENFVKEK